MDWMRYRDACMNFIRKYRYVVLVVAVGLVLMSIPSRKNEAEPPGETVPSQPAPDPARELEALLEALEGAGRVRVMLTVAKGPETVYQNDVDADSGEQTSANRQKTVVVAGTDRREEGLVRQVNPPVYQGAVILCQGADRASVRLAIVEAVSCATGLGADRISVQKMK